MVTNSALNTTNPISVVSGGSGVAATVAYTPLCGGTTTTAPLQSVASTGSSGDVLTSNGAGALASFQPAAAPSLLGSVFPVFNNSELVLNGPVVTGSSTTNVIGDNYLTFVPICISEACTLNTLLCYGQSTGGAGVVRMGMYTNVKGRPSVKIADSGTFTLTIANAVYESSSLGVSLTPGFYWLALGNNANGGTNIMLTNSDSGLVSFAYSDGSTSIVTNTVGFVKTSVNVSSALPSPIVISTTGPISTCPLVYCRLTI